MDNTYSLSDGFHTFDELYEHRSLLWLAYLDLVTSFPTERTVLTEVAGAKIAYSEPYEPPKAIKFRHYKDWFCSGLILPDGRQISYHLEEKYWDVCPGEEREWEFNGHTSNDVLAILRELIGFKEKCNE